MSFESDGNVAVVRCKYSPTFPSNLYMNTKEVGVRDKNGMIYYEFKENLRR